MVQIFRSLKYSARERQKERNGRLIMRIRRTFEFISEWLYGENNQRIYQEVWDVLKVKIEDCWTVEDIITEAGNKN